MSPPNKVWFDDRLEFLRAGLAEGITRQEFIERFAKKFRVGLNKNQLSGAINRYARGKSFAMKENTWRVKKIKYVPKIAAPNWVDLRKQIKEIIDAGEPAPVGPWGDFPDQRPGAYKCKYIHGDPGGRAKWRCCAGTVIGYGNYCPYHANLTLHSKPEPFGGVKGALSRVFQ